MVVMFVLFKLTSEISLFTVYTFSETQHRQKPYIYLSLRPSVSKPITVVERLRS